VTTWRVLGELLGHRVDQGRHRVHLAELDEQHVVTEPRRVLPGHRERGEAREEPLEPAVSVAVSAATGRKG